MRRVPAFAVLLSVCAVMCSARTLAAEKLAPLDAEFLEFLASFDSDEDWVLLTDEESAAAKPPPAKAPAAKRDGSKTEAAAKPAEQR